ncbi:hypothetical protein SLEP1_g56289 [Rubroshorea leprosula]|uniref:Wall-associated receptor kinase galacturonan-binding domain-containing protein n=1 Tax=Rubroshorea leprosula TaxID=152421 RepID=A0AAV5MJ58_9ROSI|nr:hypothetical protein SLEP1_g56289 [Rubroshorea leprosula]
MIESAVGALVKPGCKELCGNVRIPYPFGIGADCSLNKGFVVFCDETFRPPATTLTSIDREVLDISLDRNDHHVRIKVTSEDDRDDTGTGIAVDFRGSPFMFSKMNGNYTKRVEYFPAVLDWAITDEEALRLPNRDGNAFACYQFNFSQYVPGTMRSGQQCFCSDGYEGSPYLPNGCEGKLLQFSLESRDR